MTRLSKDSRKQLRTAIVNSFTSYDDLAIFVDDELDLRLQNIASPQPMLSVAQALISFVQTRGYELQLIGALHRERPDNPDVKTLMPLVQSFIRQRMALDPSQTKVEGIQGDWLEQSPMDYDEVELESFLPQPLSYEADVGQLQRGLRLANGVCKISFSDRAIVGTGFLVAPDLLLTNYHVLTTDVHLDLAGLQQTSRTLRCEFGFVSSEDEGPVVPEIFGLAEDGVLAWSVPKQLDYVLLRLDPKVTEIGNAKPLPMPKTDMPPLQEKAALQVLQHPQGEMMQVSLSASGVVQVDEDRNRIWYVNRTQGGSSGSPCFNKDWNLIAIHHAAKSKGFGSVREGILLSSILADLSSKSLSLG